MHKTIRYLSAFIITALIVSPFQGAHAQSNKTLSAFHAIYQVISEGTLSLEGESERSLSLTQDNQWQFQSKASAFFASLEESSRFSWVNGHIQPRQYLYTRKVLGKARKANLSFNWKNQTVINDVQNKPWRMKIKTGVLDKLSYQLQLQADIAAGKQDLSYEVADGGRLKHYQFAVKGHENISTPAGTYNAIRVERVYEKPSARKTLIWFAPSLNYQLIKLYRQEKKDKTYSLLLKAVTK
ncbi:MAG: DUF3108 domain-containing protein [Pontibacterium sp.]